MILLTSENQPYIQTQIERLGIDHTLTKTIDPEELLHLIAKVLQSELTEKIANYLDDLTPRELEILEWLVKGDSNKEIARELHISESTVKVHVQNILKKFKVSSRVEAAVYAVRNELSTS
ncbi:MAG TPA: response regulator transcription factor [Candidatus Ignatzschineria merdigallinarum]|uniref:Response regulator transcription factor n=1 Tax=Candidatus Ignatzschineria merdigallinarum TaxID=2838621 RepID=A0A9D1Q949_9GAMM|nr:response regulator transcription factor [Candidatus Ignatzschineria merdigallinarum]